MDPASIAFTIGTIFLTKALEKSGEKFGEATIAKLGQSLAKIRQHSPETAMAIEAGDPQVLNLGTATLEQIPVDPIFTELAAALDAETNQELRKKLAELKQTAVQNPNKLAEKIGIVAQAHSNVRVDNLSF